LIIEYPPLVEEDKLTLKEERLGGAVSNSGHRQFLLNYRKALGVVVAAASLPQESVSETEEPGRQAGKSNWGHPPHTEAQQQILPTPQATGLS
jgi:hypothetical protein